MAKAQAQEPSMEEILASIRRIIADEDKGKPEPAAETHVSEEDLDKLFASGGDDEAEAEEDVLDLTEEAIAEPDMAEDDLAFAEVEEPPPPPPPPPKPAPVVAKAPPPAAPPRPVPQPAPAPAPVMAAAPEPAAPAIISPATGQAVSAAFGSLNTALHQPAGRTVEQIVQDMLRPMLQGWLDANLPQIVERLVKAEIERVARGG